MSANLDGNPHYAVATTVSVEDGAEAEATLALAFEQRTANLIAWVAAHGEDPSWVTVEIQNRLGLA